MIASVVALLAGHLASGTLFVTAVLALKNKLPESFLRFCAASSAGVAGIASFMGPGGPRLSWLALALAASLWYLAIRRGAGRSKAVAALVAGASIAAPSLFALSSGPDAPVIAVAGSTSSALLLGATIVAMILGHWYLVDTSLAITPLRDGATWFWIAVAFRWLVVALVLVYGGWEVLEVSRAADLILSTGGLFFLFRTLMGLAAPLLLAGLVWQTVKIRSTQSATGLLYVASFLVLFGEPVSQFLFVSTGYPL